MSDRTDLIALLEGQAVYIGTCRRDDRITRIKLLLREEIMDRNGKALQILRHIKPCQRCGQQQTEIDRLRLELGQAQEKLGRIRAILGHYEEIHPPGAINRDDSALLLNTLGRILNGVNR
jgi:hypothetical protein